MTRTKNTRTKLLRLGQILRVFMEKERVSSTWLSKEFHTTPRTIQRDLQLLKESGFPIHELQKGNYHMSKDLIKNLEVFDDTELALVVALKNMVGQLGQSFQKAANSVLDRLHECVTTMPVFVKIDDAVPMNSLLLNRIVKAIRDKKQAGFHYDSGKGSHPVTIEPYRIAYFGGFWYLIGKEPGTGIIKRYALDKIGNFKLSKTGFRAVPEKIDTLLKGSANIWFTEENNIEVTVLIDGSCSNYFKRRKMLPEQEIKEERADGSLVVSCKVGQYEAIRGLLKSWIPHILILSPEDFKMSLVKDMKQWIKRQEME